MRYRLCPVIAARIVASTGLHDNRAESAKTGDSDGDCDRSDRYGGNREEAGGGYSAYPENR